jgi:hypothetical protein
MRDSALYSDTKDYYNIVTDKLNPTGKRNQGSFNGEYAYESSNGGPGGFVPNMHVPAVRDRFIALMQAFAAEFNTDPYLEAIVFSEASIAEPIGSAGSAHQVMNSGTPNQIIIDRPTTDGAEWADLDEWYTEMANGLIAARMALSNIQLCQWVNAPRIKMEDFVPILKANKIGIGMTDLCWEDKGFNYRSDAASPQPRGNIEWCQLHEGVAMVMGHAAKTSYIGTVAARGQVAGTIQGEPRVYPTYPGLGPTRQAVRDFAVSTAKVTHLVWIYNTGVQVATGDMDTAAPDTALPYTATSDAYSGNYAGKKYNVVTANYLHGSTNIGTNTARPVGWS